MIKSYLNLQQNRVIEVEKVFFAEMEIKKPRHPSWLLSTNLNFINTNQIFMLQS